VALGDQGQHLAFPAGQPGQRVRPSAQQLAHHLRVDDGGGTLLLGVLWGGWHLPLFLTAWAGWPHVRWYDPVEFIATAVALSIPITWVFNRTGQSLPLVMLLHSNVNTVFTLAWPTLFPALDAFHDSLRVLLIACALAAVLLLVATRGRLGAGQRPTSR
jgi:hypothetical protein